MVNISNLSIDQLNELIKESKKRIDSLKSLESLSKEERIANLKKDPETKKLLKDLDSLVAKVENFKPKELSFDIHVKLEHEIEFDKKELKESILFGHPVIEETNKFKITIKGLDKDKKEFVKEELEEYLTESCFGSAPFSDFQIHDWETEISEINDDLYGILSKYNLEEEDAIKELLS